MKGRPGWSSEVRRAFWGQVRAGSSRAVAADAVGVSRTVADRWFREAGGMIPKLSLPGVVRPRLTIAQREEIAIGHAQGHTNAQIARRVGCHRSTIGRELKLNTTVYAPRGRRPAYRATMAQKRTEWRARRTSESKLAGNTRLRQAVQERLKLEHSPEQISARLRIDFADDESMRISHESIYRALYVQGKGELSRDLTARLRTGRAVRKPRHTVGERLGRIVGMVGIAQRPPEVEDRAVPGHWEGDLITGELNKSAIGTLVERTSGFCQLLHLPGSHGADVLQEAMVASMSRLPETLRRTLTWDQGIEMANHVQIAAATDLDIYFCDPHSPWQRGSNENFNGLARQYFPKSSDLSVYAPDYLEHVAAKLNNRPRKRLGYKTPAEALDQLLSEPRKTTRVASTA